MNTRIFSKNFIFGTLVLIGGVTGCQKSEIEKPVNSISNTEKSATNTVYIDPSYTGVKAGTIAQPYTSWTDVVWTDGLTCLIKAGSVLNVAYNLRVSANNTTVGAYGTGDRPHIISSVSGGKVLDVAALTDVTVQDLEIESASSGLTGLHFMNNVRGKVINCKIHGATWGIRNISSTGMFRIINSEVYMTGDDGCFISAVDSVELSGSYIHDVNQKYFINTSETYSGGDCFQMVNISYFNIHNNTIDHTTTGNKFCIIAGGDANVTSHGIIEYNHLLRNGGILLYMSEAENIIVRYNKFENSGTAIYNHSNSPQIYYNEFNNITGTVFMLGAASTSSVSKFYNNSFFNINVLSNAYTDVVSFQNNIFSKCYGTLFVSGTTPNADYNCYYKISNIGTAALGTHSIQADPLFNDTSKSDFSLKSGSPCIGVGAKIWTATNDIDGNVVPNNTLVDMGCHEYYSLSNVAPLVSITTPSNGTNYNAPASITISATASDADGSIAKVEFYNGTTKLGESTTSPYTYTYSNVPSAVYNFKAVATDNLGSQTTSSGVVIIYVNAVTNVAPVISITAPSNGANYNAPASITISATASDADGSIAKVEFYNGTTKLGESTTSPYTFTYSNVPSGVYNFKAVATDNLGSQTTSSNVVVVYVNTVANVAPVVSITSPSNGANYTAPATFKISATASDADGSIAKVEFFNGSVKLGESTTSPYSFTCSSLPSAVYKFTAVATDNSGSKTTSTAKIVYVNN
jgi:hypothetical protein